MDKERVYIIGSYCPKNCSLHDASRIAQHNVDKAIEAGNRLLREGYNVFIPHLSHYVHTHYSSTSDLNGDWYDIDMSFLEHWATAIYILDGCENSKGSQMEIEKANKLGLKLIVDDFEEYEE
jgi:hypothetical protein